MLRLIDVAATQLLSPHLLLLLSRHLRLTLDSSSLEFKCLLFLELHLFKVAEI